MFGKSGRNSSILAVVAVLSFGFANFAEATELGGEILSRTAWQSVDWDNPQASRVGKILFSLDDSSSGDAVMLFGAHFKVTQDTRPDITSIFHLEGKDQYEDCREFQSKLISKLGNAVFDDGTQILPLSEIAKMRVVFEFFQWDVGKTRIIASCIGSQVFPPLEEGNKSLTWSIAISSTSGLSQIKPKFALRCSRTIAYSDETTTAATDLAIWVDPNTKVISNPDQTSLSDAGTFQATEDQIRFAVTRNDVKSNYTIDRVTGSLNAQVTTKDLTATISGICEKVQTLAPKF